MGWRTVGAGAWGWAEAEGTEGAAFVGRGNVGVGEVVLGQKVVESVVGGRALAGGCGGVIAESLQRAEPLEYLGWGWCGWRLHVLCSVVVFWRF